MVISYSKKTMSQLFLILTGLFYKKKHKILKNLPIIDQSFYSERLFKAINPSKPTNHTQK